MKIIETLEFLNEEVILIKKTKPLNESTTTTQIFATSRINSEMDSLIRCQVILVGQEQQKLKVGNEVLVRQDILTKHITVDGEEVEETAYVLGSHKMIHSKCLN